MSQPEIDENALFSEQDPALIDCELEMMSQGQKTAAENFLISFDNSIVLALHWWRLHAEDVSRQLAMYTELKRVVTEVDKKEAKRYGDPQTRWEKKYRQQISLAFLDQILSSCQTEQDQLSGLCDAVEHDNVALYQAVDSQIEQLIELSRRHRAFRDVLGGDLTLQKIDDQINFWSSVLKQLSKQFVNESVIEVVMTAAAR